MSSLVAAVLLMATAMSLPLAAAARLLSQEPTLYSPWACGVIADSFNLLPGFNWGTTPPAVQTAWSESDCDSKICAYYVAKYSLVPGKSMGSLPSTLLPSWNWQRPNSKGNCSAIWATAAADITTATGATLYSPWGCGAIITGYGHVPGFDWGTTPDAIKPKLGDSNCDAKICAFWVDRHNVVPNQSWGTLPAELYRSWDWVRGNSGQSCNDLWYSPIVAS